MKSLAHFIPIRLFVVGVLSWGCSDDDVGEPGDTAPGADGPADLADSLEDPIRNEALVDQIGELVELDAVDVPTDAPDEADAQVCGSSNIPPRVPPESTLWLATNGEIDLTPGSSSGIFFFQDGYTAFEYLPPRPLTITTAAAVTDDGTIYVTANYGLYRLTAGTPPQVEQLTSHGGFFLSVSSGGMLYTEFVECGEAAEFRACIIEYDPSTGQERIIAHDLGDSIFTFHHTPPVNGRWYLDAMFREGEEWGARMIWVEEDGTWGEVPGGLTGAKAVDDQGNLFILFGNSIYQMGEDGTPFELVCFDAPDDYSSGDVGAMAVNADGDFLFTQEHRELPEGEEKNVLSLAGTRVFRVDRHTGDLSVHADGFFGPRGLAVFPDGYSLVVTELETGSLRTVTPDGEVTDLLTGNLMSGTVESVFRGDDELVVATVESAMVLTANISDDDPNLVGITPLLGPINTYIGVASEFAYFSMDADADGNVYMAEYAIELHRHGVSMIDADDDTLSWFTQEPPTPNGLAFDDDGDLWVSNAVGGIIDEYSPDAVRLGGTTEPLQQPADVTWHDGYLYVAVHGTGEVVRVDPSDYSTSVFAGPLMAGDAPSGLFDLAFAPSGNLVVTAGGVMFLVNPTGEVNTLAGTAGNLGFHGVFFRDSEMFLHVNPNQIIRVVGPFE